MTTKVAFLLSVACVLASFGYSDAMSVQELLQIVPFTFGNNEGPLYLLAPEPQEEESAVLTPGESDGVFTITEEFYNIPQEEFTSVADALLSVQDEVTLVTEEDSQLQGEEEEEENYFRVINESPQVVWAAVGSYAHTTNEEEEYVYSAQGWFAVEPYTTETIWRTQDPLIYVRLESNGAIEPLASESAAYFCIDPIYDFHSEETVEYESFYLMKEYADIANGNYVYEAGTGDSCAMAGGEHHRFYQYDTNTDFLIV